MDERRKKYLYGALAFILIAMAGDWAFRNGYEEPWRDVENRRQDVMGEIKKKSREIKKARKANDQLAVWEGQSLPSQIDVARSLYRTWLLERAEAVGLTDRNVESGAPVSRKGLYQSLSFSMRGRGSPEQLTQFLFDFYRADFLHQVRSISIVPQRNSGTLDLNMSFEALVLARATNEDNLPTGTSDRLAFDELADYRAIIERDLFGVGSAVNAVDLTFLTGVTYVGGQPQAWFELGTDDKVVKLSKGQRLEVGPFQGTVVGIEGNDVVVESDGERWLMTIGENLSQAVALPPGL